MFQKHEIFVPGSKPILTDLHVCRRTYTQSGKKGALLIKSSKTSVGKVGGTHLTTCNEASLPFLSAEAHFLGGGTPLNQWDVFSSVILSLVIISTS